MIARFAIVAVTMITVAHAQQGTKTTVSLDLSEGTTYWRTSQTEQLTRTEIGEETLITRRKDAETYTFEVTRVTEDAISGTFTFLVLATELVQGTDSQSYDSRTDPPEEGEALIPFARLAMKPVDVTVSPHGEVMEISGVDRHVDDAAGVREMTASLEFYINKRFVYLPPKPVAVGDTWTTTEELTDPVPLRIDVTYELLSDSEDAAKIESNTTINVSSEKLPNGFPLKNYGGEMATLYTVSPETGWLTDANYFQKMEGNAVFPQPNQQDPASATITMTTEGKMKGGTGAPPTEEDDAP